MLGRRVAESDGPLFAIMEASSQFDHNHGPLHLEPGYVTGSELAVRITTTTS
jgi:hypothetical protein